MLGWGRKGQNGGRDGRNDAPTPAGPQAGARPDAATGFPRGVGDDPYRPGATAWWPSDEQVARFLPEWRPGSASILLGRDGAGRYYGIEDDRHLLTVAGSRSGKLISLIAGNLAFWPGSAICIDPKGELATITASRRSAAGSDWSEPMRPGHGRVFALDPFRRVTGPARIFADAAFNPLADLDPTTEQGLNLAWQIADALIIQSIGDGAHWTQSARSFMRGLVLYVASVEPPASRNLITVRRRLTQDRKPFLDMLDHMARFKEKPGLELIGYTADALKSKPPVERFSVVSTCETHTAFLEGEAMRRVLAGSSFRLEDLKTDLVTVYLCLPAMYLATHGRWLRLMVSLAADAMERTGPIEKGKPPVLFVLDEFAALGHMETIEKAAGQIAGFGVKLWPIVQDLTQLQRDYREAWETFMGNAGVLTFFGNTDITTAEHVSKRLGDTEVIRHVESVQETEGGSAPDLIGGLTGKIAGTSQKSVNRSRAQQVVRGPLMNPNEIMQCFARDAGKLLAFVSSATIPPVALWRSTYFAENEDALYGGRFDPAPGQAPPRTNRAQREARRS